VTFRGVFVLPPVHAATACRTAADLRLLTLLSSLAALSHRQMFLDFIEKKTRCVRSGVGAVSVVALVVLLTARR